MSKPETRRLAREFVARVESIEKELGGAFPGGYASARETIRGHLAEMQKALAAGK